MKKIKVKLKHVIAIIILVGIVVPNCIALYGFYRVDNIRKYGVYVKDDKSIKVDGTTIGILDFCSNIPTVMYSRGEIYNTIGESYYSFSKNIFRISSEYQGATYFKANKEGLLKAVEYFEEGVKLGVNSRYYIQNAISLTNCYLILGEREKAYELAEKTITSKDKDVKIAGYLLKIMILSKERKYNESLEICRKNLDSDIIKLAYLNTLILSGDTKTHDEYAKELIMNDKKEHRDNSALDNESPNSFYSMLCYFFKSKDVRYDNLDFELRDMHALMERKEGNGAFKGTLTKEGQAVPYSLIYIKNRNINSATPLINFSDISSYFGYTDKDGNFEINGLQDGEYDVNIVISSIYNEDGKQFKGNNGLQKLKIENGNVENRTIDLR